MADFTIDTYRPDYLAEMVAAYNDQARHESQIAPLTPDLFQQLVAAKTYFDPAGLFVARRQGRPVGWSHACRVPGTEAWQTPDRIFPRIRMIAFSPHDLHVGRALVEEATRWLESTGGAADTEAIHCDHGYPFYRGIFMGGEPMAPASMAHLHAALATAGYQPVAHSIMFRAVLAARPDLPPLAPEFDLRDAPLEIRHDMQRQSWTGFAPREAKIFQGETAVGSIGYVVIPHLAACNGAPVMNIWSLGIAETHRRKGLASVLVALSLQNGWDQGAKSATLSTQASNLPAHITYQRAGFFPHALLIGRMLRRAH